MRVLRSVFAVLWAAGGIGAIIAIAIWWDRAASRHAAPSLSFAGGAFVVGMAVLVLGVAFAYVLSRRGQHEWSTVMDVFCVALFVSGIYWAVPAIGWGASVRLAGIVLGGLVYLAVVYLLAWLED